MASFVTAFKRDLGLEITEKLGGRYRFFRSTCQLRAADGEGQNIVRLLVAAKWSPLVSIYFGFGRGFSAASRIERRYGMRQLSSHIGANSYCNAWIRELSYSGPMDWEVDIRSPSPTLAVEVADAIERVAHPWFARFGSITAARDALAADDPFCPGGAVLWSPLLALDLALGDRSHFERWVSTIKPFYRKQAEEVLARLPPE